jgi:hypothetical protein
MKKEKKQIVVGVILILLAVSAGILFISTLPAVSRHTNAYTLRGQLYNVDDLGNDSYYFFMSDTSHRRWGGTWTFPYQQGKEKFYFTDIGDESISNFVDRNIDITYTSDGIESKISGIKYTYYDGLCQDEKELAFDEWMQENYMEILIEYNEYLEQLDENDISLS